MASDTDHNKTSNSQARRPQGRPSLPLNLRRRPRSVSLPAALWARLDAVKTADHLTVSFLVERAVTNLLDRREGGAQ